MVRRGGHLELPRSFERLKAARVAAAGNGAASDLDDATHSRWMTGVRGGKKKIKKVKGQEHSLF